MKINEQQQSLHGRWFEFFAQRLREIHSAVEGGTPDSVITPADTDGVIAQVLQLDQKLEHRYTEKTRLQLVYLAMLGRYAGQSELEYWGGWVTTLGMSQVLNEFVRALEFRLSQASGTFKRLRRAPKNSLYVDVSHTLDHPYNSGIQRVVRKSVESMTRAGMPIVLFRVDFSTGQPCALTDSEIERALNFVWSPAKGRSLEKGDAEHLVEALKEVSVEFHRWIRNRLLVPFVRWVMGHPVFSKYVESAKAKLRERRLSGQSIGSTEVDILFFFDSTILLPELACEVVRIEYYLTLKSSLPNQFRMIVYDMVPTLVPEYCAVAEVFPHYLRLLRVVDRVNCISRSVMEDVRTYSQITPRNTSLPKIEFSFSYLVGDFNAPVALGADAEVPASNVPRILCVGTFEPRKNQFGVLKAAYFLRQKKGLKFKLAFVGSPGWNNHLFENECRRVDPNGEWIEIHSKVSDARLAALYRSAKFSMFCSHAEGFGLPILESLHFGKPVVVSNRGSMAEVAELGGGCVLVNPDEILEMAAGIERLLIDETFYQERVNSIKKRDHSTWMTYAKEIFEFATKPY